ncbi:hypothetical protein I315_05609 [Cryptococcus gattii Ru294]|nr:hypothetical protein I315_05609 [Cryptococcus gattii Ru294]
MYHLTGCPAGHSMPETSLLTLSNIFETYPSLFRLLTMMRKTENRLSPIIVHDVQLQQLCLLYGQASLR